MSRHPHADLIHKWAEGAEIEVLDAGCWKKAHPFFHADFEYRIKPTPKPDVVRYLVEHDDGFRWHAHEVRQIKPNGFYPCIKVVKDGETGKLKSAEVL